MEIREIREQKWDYLDLLLQGDESAQQIAGYLDRGALYVLLDGGLRAVCVVTREEPGVCELKNLAVVPDSRRKGYGRAMVEAMKDRFRVDCRVMRVGTGESPLTLPFYEACGFVVCGRIPDFFIQHYDHPIVEAGVTLRDMVLLEAALPPMRVDFHTHTAASFDSEAPIDDMCEAAMATGLSALAITDHVELVDYLADGMDRTAAVSFAAAEAAARRYAGRLRIARGIELGEPLYDLPLAERLLTERPYDFVLASVHRLREEPDYYFWDFADKDIGREMERYFEEVLATVRWGRFHSLAHLTYPFRYMPADRRPADYNRWQAVIDEILRELAVRGLALEINTSGLRGPIGQTQPDAPLIRRFRALGGEYLTIGSDAHTPGDVGAGWKTATRLAQEAGFEAVTMFFEGRPEQVRLS